VSAPCWPFASGECDESNAWPTRHAIAHLRDQQRQLRHAVGARFRKCSRPADRRAGHDGRFCNNSLSCSKEMKFSLVDSKSHPPGRHCFASRAVAHGPSTGARASGPGTATSARLESGQRCAICWLSILKMPNMTPARDQSPSAVTALWIWCLPAGSENVTVFWVRWPAACQLCRAHRVNEATLLAELRAGPPAVSTGGRDIASPSSQML